MLSGYWSKFEAILHEFALLRVPIAFRTRSGLFSVPQCVTYQVWVLVMTCKKVWLSYLSSKKFATMLKFYFRAGTNGKFDFRPFKISRNATSFRHFQ